MPGSNAPKGGIGLDTAKNISSAVTSPVGRLAGLALPGVGTLSSIANIAANNTANTALGIGGINFNPFSANAAMDAVNRTGVGDADFRNEDGTFTPNKNNIQTRLHDSAGSPRGEHGFQSNDSGNSGDRGGSGGYGGGQTDAGNDTGSRGFYANGGQTQGPDPLIMGAVAAIMGSHPEPQQAIAAFVQVHGPEAFTQLRQQVIASASADQRSQEGIGGLIEGPGTGTSDSIPGQITQNGQPVEDIKVSNGEYILPEKAVEAFPQEKAGLDQFVANATGARPNNA